MKKGIWKRQKFCSKSCRERQWRTLNPDTYEKHRIVGYNKWKESNIVLCRFCKKEIPNNERKSGKVLCSKECRDKQRMKNILKYRSKSNLAKDFREFKESFGCCICKYNKHGGSLDFHHIDPNKKLYRISKTNWGKQSKEYFSEVKKCILICKNCHYELHTILHDDKDRYLEEISHHLYIHDFNHIP